jgi:hypothetical protein
MFLFADVLQVYNMEGIKFCSPQTNSEIRSAASCNMRHELESALSQASSLILTELRWFLRKREGCWELGVV